MTNISLLPQIKGIIDFNGQIDKIDLELIGGFDFNMKKIYAKKGDDIIKEGMQSDCAYIIDEGSVQVSKTASDGAKQILSTLQEKEIFGELGLIDGLPRSATVTALEDCTVSILTPEAFNSLAKRNPQALMPILKILANRLRATLKMIEELQTEVHQSTS